MMNFGCNKSVFMDSISCRIGVRMEIFSVLAFFLMINVGSGAFRF